MFEIFFILFINKIVKNECVETRFFLFLQITLDLNKIKKTQTGYLYFLVPGPWTQFVFTDPGPQFEFPGPKFVFTGPGPNLYLPTLAPSVFLPTLTEKKSFTGSVS